MQSRALAVNSPLGFKGSQNLFYWFYWFDWFICQKTENRGQRTGGRRGRW